MAWFFKSNDKECIRIDEKILSICTGLSSNELIKESNTLGCDAFRNKYQPMVCKYWKAYLEYKDLNILNEKIERSKKYISFENEYDRVMNESLILTLPKDLGNNAVAIYKLLKEKYYMDKDTKIRMSQYGAIGDRLKQVYETNSSDEKKVKKVVDNSPKSKSGRKPYDQILAELKEAQARIAELEGSSLNEDKRIIELAKTLEITESNLTQARDIITKVVSISERYEKLSDDFTSISLESHELSLKMKESFNKIIDSMKL